MGIKIFVDLPAGSYKLSGWMKVENYQGANGKVFGFNAEVPKVRVDYQFIKKMRIGSSITYVLNWIMQLVLASIV